MKVIKFTNERDLIVVLPLKIIAHDRANYYKLRDDDTTYASEFDYVMNDDYAAIDWFRNNMNPDEVEEHFVILREETRVSLCNKIDQCEAEITTIDDPK